MRGSADRADAAREYLSHARKCADIVNAVEMPYINENSAPARVRDLAIMNALAAIAVMQVPDEPGMRLA